MTIKFLSRWSKATAMMVALGGVLSLWGIRPSQAADISGQIDCADCSVGDSIVVALSTRTMTWAEANTANPAVLSSQRVTLDGNKQANYLFTGLYLGADYRIFAFDDSDSNDTLNFNEPMGGYGPFPGKAMGALVSVSTGGAPNRADFTLTHRGAISFGVSNQSPQVGGQLGIIVESEPLDDSLATVIHIPTGLNTGRVNGLVLGHDYRVTAYVETPTGQWDVKDPHEDSSSPSDLVSLSAAHPLKAAGTLTIQSSGRSGSLPSNIRLTDDFGGSSQMIAVDAPSNRMLIKVMDLSGQTTGATADTEVTLAADGAQGPLTSIQVSLDGGQNFESLPKTITLSTGVSLSSYFVVKCTETLNGFHLQARADHFPTNAEQRSSFYYFQVLNAGTGFSDVSIRTSSQGFPLVGVTSVTITPDRDGVDESAVIQCTPPMNSSWEVLISSEPTFRTGVVRHLFAWGNQPLTWFGDTDNGSSVPAGEYFVRLLLSGGGIKDDSLRVIVNTAYLSGRVLSGGDPVPDVSVNCWGPGGGGFGRTAADGRFYVAGLKSGQSYGLDFSKPGLSSKRLENKSANQDLGDITLIQGATARFHVTLSAAAPYDLWGGINLHTQDWSSNANGSLRIPMGETNSNNGVWSISDPAYSTWTAVGLNPNTEYLYDLQINEFTRISGSFTSPDEGQTIDISTTASKKATVYGWVSFPSAVQSPWGGVWVNVDARLSGASMSSIWGGAWVQNGLTQAVYRLSGMDAGVYTLTANAQGYVSQTAQVTVLDDQDVGNNSSGGADFPVFDTGGTVTGVLKLLGDSSHAQSNNWYGGGFSCNPGEITLGINAWSPGQMGGANTAVCIATSPTSAQAPFTLTGLSDGEWQLFVSLQGFQLDPPGPQRVTVAQAVGTSTITLAALEGTIDLTATLNDGADATLLDYQLQGNGPDAVSTSGSLDSQAHAVISNLGTGLYQLTLMDHATGLRKTIPVAVKNRHTEIVVMDMTDDTFTIAGSVTLEGVLNLPAPYNVSVSSWAGLVQAWTDTPAEVQVFALPINENDWREPDPVATAPLTVHTDSATFQASGLVAGSYLVRVRMDLDPNPPNPYCPECGREPGKPEFSSTRQEVFISSSDFTDVALVLKNGYTLSGALTRPAGDASTDARMFQLRLQRSDRLAVWKTTVTTGGNGSAAYSFSHLSNGTYLLETRELDANTHREMQPPKYGAAAVSVVLDSADKTKDVSLVQVGSVVGKLRISGELITYQNSAQKIPQSFGINANANPWVPGGYAQALWRQDGPGGLYISSATNQFQIVGMIPGTNYDIGFRGFTDVGQDMLSKGQKPLMPVVVSGVKVEAGQTKDMGIVELSEGNSLMGTVVDTNNAPLPTVRVVARPATSGGGDQWQYQVETFTNELGEFTLQGVDKSKRYYDVVASPRFEGGSIYSQLGGKKYAQETLRMVDVTVSTSLVFHLVEAKGELMGQVATVDGGALGDPFDGKGGVIPRRARIVLHRDGDLASDDPLGEIEEVSDAQGHFHLKGLKPGHYTVRALSLNYAGSLVEVDLTDHLVDVGTLTLQKGATVSGQILTRVSPPTYPDSSQVNFIVAVDDSFQDFIFGQVTQDETTKEVSGYSLSGFRPGVTYSFVMGNDGDELVSGYDVNDNTQMKTYTCPSSTDAQSVDLLYSLQGPTVYVSQLLAGGAYQLKFFSTHKLRNLTNLDNDLSSLVTLVDGLGTIDSRSLNSSRDQLDVVYTPVAGEATFTLNMAFTSSKLRTDGTPFTFSKDFTFFTGIGNRRDVTVANLTGGQVNLEGDPSGAAFDAGTFDVASSSAITVGVQSAEALSDLSVAIASNGALKRGPRLAQKARALGPQAYPSLAMFKAIQRAPSVSPLSSFYDVFLPAGVSHTLRKPATLTLRYDEGQTPAGLNVYYYNPDTDQYVLEGTGREVDEVNRTISVKVEHMSTFVVLNNSAPTIGGPNTPPIPGDTTYTGTEIFVHAVPNPFDLKRKTVTLNHTNPASSQDTDGTILALGIPPGMSGTVKIEIFTATGLLVRKISLQTPAGGSYYYQAWDGRNDQGEALGSGVYIGRLTLNDGNEKFFKVAVLK